MSLKQVAEFARMHHGVVTRQICIDSGASARTVDRWVERGVMHRLYPNVYSFGHDLLPPYGKRLA
ncbi:MAG TPA: type IV toxin-antitoxin system AbiEi family antitoxin domain-containing protein, partial [Baekduia sp.]|nr:type IV toxin-antitoxin system AbiEi family antitoxin domain-containing protein [Baekduia sp.]